MFKAGIHVVMLLCVATNSAAAQESGSSRGSSLPGSQSSDRSKPPATSGPTSRSPTLREQSPVQTGATLHAGAAAVQNSEPISVMSTKDSARYRRAVYRLQAIPAVDVARTLDQVFRAEGKVVLHDVSPMQVVIVPEVIGNNLIVSGPPEAIEEVGRLIEDLDRPAAMVRLEVVIAEAPAGPLGDATSSASAEKKGVAEAKAASGKEFGAQQLHAVPTPDEMEVLIRGQLTTLDNQAAFLQMGQRVPRVTGTSVSPVGTTPNVSLENVGFIVGLTPRVGPDRAVTLELDVEDSHLGSAEQGAPLATHKDGQTIRNPNVETLTSQATVRIPDGQTITLAGIAREGKSGKQRFILVTPHVVPIAGNER